MTLFEKDDAAGGLLRFGIPDFKLNKVFIDRRLKIMMEEGLEVRAGVEAGKDISTEELLSSFDAICIAVGAMKPRDLHVEGRELDGVHFAMEFLTQQNRIIRGQVIPYDKLINARGKDVVVLGGGDTGSDCVGTSIRQGAKSVTQIEILPKPPIERSPDNPWPYYDKILKTSTSHEEGCERMWNLSTTKILGKDRRVNAIEVQEVNWIPNGYSSPKMEVVEGSRREINADLVLLALGFLQPVHEGLLNNLKLDYTDRNNVRINSEYLTSHPKVFAAGDTVLGASLVVRAIHSGRQAAAKIDRFLKS